MKKNFLWLIAAILTCGFMFTSCSIEDDPVAPEQPDQVSMFVQNVLADSRYYIRTMTLDGQSDDYLCLDVASYEEALAEFLKLLPEGVAETAYEESLDSDVFLDPVWYSFITPQSDEAEQAIFCRVLPKVSKVAGYAAVMLTDELREALGVMMIMYMPYSVNDDMDNFVQSLMAVLPKSLPDPEDPTHLVCTVASEEEYSTLASAFLTPKMISSIDTTENGGVFTLTDEAGNSYGKLYIIGKTSDDDDWRGRFVFDEDLQASMAMRLGMAFSQLTFYLAAPEE